MKLSLRVDFSQPFHYSKDKSMRVAEEMMELDNFSSTVLFSLRKKKEDDHP